MYEEYNYDLQVWVSPNGYIRMCGHPVNMRINSPCCNAAHYAGLTVTEAIERKQDAERRSVSKQQWLPVDNPW